MRINSLNRFAVVVMIFALICAFAVPLTPAVAAASYYVAKADSAGTVGDGSEKNPFRGLEQAMNAATDGDTLILAENVQYAEKNGGEGFTFNKNVTIQGEDHTLTFRGTNVYFGADVIFDSLVLNLVPEGSEQPVLWAGGHDLTFANVSTNLGDAQKDLRPSIYTGNKTGASTGSSTITINGGSSETRFAEIVAGDQADGSSLATDIVINSQWAKVDKGITSHTSGSLNVTSSSKNLKKFTGTADNPNETVVFKNVISSSLELSNIDYVKLQGKSQITPTAALASIPGTLTVDDGSTLLLINAKTVDVGTLEGTGTVVLGADGTLNAGTVNDVARIEARAWNENEKNNLLAREFFTATTVNKEPKVFVTLSGEEAVVNKNAEGKWLGATDHVEPISLTAPKDPVTVPEGQGVTAGYVYSLLIVPEGVKLGHVDSLPDSQANTISKDGKYRGYVYVKSEKLPSTDEYGTFEVVVAVVDEIAGVTTYPTVTLIKNKPKDPVINPDNPEIPDQPDQPEKTVAVRGNTQASHVDSNLPDMGSHTGPIAALAIASLLLGWGVKRSRRIHSCSTAE